MTLTLQSFKTLCPKLSFYDVISYVVSRDGKADESCAICMEDLIGQNWIGSAMLLRRIASCNHHFHEDCISKWLTENRDTCPLCRKIPRSVPNAETLDIPIADCPYAMSEEDERIMNELSDGFRIITLQDVPKKQIQEELGLQRMFEPRRDPRSEFSQQLREVGRLAEQARRIMVPQDAIATVARNRYHGGMTTEQILARRAEQRDTDF